MPVRKGKRTVNVKGIVMRKPPYGRFYSQLQKKSNAAREILKREAIYKDQYKELKNSKAPFRQGNFVIVYIKTRDPLLGITQHFGCITNNKKVGITHREKISSDFSSFKMVKLKRPIIMPTKSVRMTHVAIVGHQKRK